MSDRFIIPGTEFAKGGQMVTIEEEFVSIREAAKLLHVSQSTIWRWINHGELPAYRFGYRRVLLKKADLAPLITPARQAQQKGVSMTGTERKGRPITVKEQQQMLTAGDAAKQLHTGRL